MAAHLPTVTASIRVSPGFHKSYVHLADENPSIIFFFLDHRQFILKTRNADSKTWTRHISLDAEWSWIQRVCAYHAQALRMRPGERRETQLLQIFRVISVCAEEVEICGESQQ